VQRQPVVGLYVHPPQLVPGSVVVVQLFGSAELTVQPEPVHWAMIEPSYQVPDLRV